MVVSCLAWVPGTVLYSSERTANALTCWVTIRPSPISLIYSLEMSGICVCRQDPNKTTGFTCVALYLSPWVSWPFKVMEGTELVVQEICTLDSAGCF